MRLLLLLMFQLLSLLSLVTSFNITEELEGHPNFSEFNDALTETGLAKSINNRHTITVCALTNTQMKSLKASMGTDASDPKKLAAFIRPLVLLTFIDPSNPHTAKSINGSQQVSSMYQAAGTALEDQGMANLTKTKKGSLQIVTAGGSNTTITKAVRVIKYELSIVQVSNYVSPDGVVESEDRPVVPDAPVAPLASAKPPPAKDSADSSDDSDEEEDDSDSGSTKSGAAPVGNSVVRFYSLICGGVFVAAALSL